MNHYDDPCANECGRLVGHRGSLGFCNACRQAQRRAAFKAGPPQPCSIGRCSRIVRMPGEHLCEMHRGRLRRTGDVGPADSVNRDRGTGVLTKNGYVVIQRNGRRVPEHHWIVEETLGRELHDFENVHHKNGVRHDNRIENLEIWVIPQPRGQRPEDLLTWCAENHQALAETSAWNAA